jgi:hypothetical protein
MNGTVMDGFTILPGSNDAINKALLRNKHARAYLGFGVTHARTNTHET